MWENCRTLQNDLVSMRRDLHRIPELGKELPKTRAYVENKLREYGIEYKLSELDSGLIAEIKGGMPGKTIALRADMDALPITEETGVDYMSEHPGCMHACGHDTHMTMLLGAAKVLQENRASLKGNVRLFFQTAEELARGAEIVIANGGMEGVDAVFGTHIGSIRGKDIPAGDVVVSPGCIMASFDKFIIKVRGKGCHGSTPEKGTDPINIASHIVLALQTIDSREIAATRPVVVTLGKISGGSQYNIIPEEVVIEGTLRALEEEVRQYAARRIGEIAKGTAMTFGAEADYEMIWGAPPVINEEAMTALAIDSAVSVLGKDHVITKVDAPLMGGEDFAYYLEKAPGAFMFLSSVNAEKKTDYPHHCSNFNIDEDVLWKGSAVFVSIAENFLK